MILTCITDVPAFFRRVANCEGEVLFIDKGGNTRDLKQLAIQAGDFGEIFGGSRISNLELHISDLKDRQRMIRYMTEIGYE